MQRIGLMVPGAGVSPTLPHSILKGGFHIEQTGHISDGTHHEKEQRKDQGEFGDGISGCSRNPAAAVLAFEAKTACGLACANRNSRRTLQVTSHIDHQECSSRRRRLVTTFKNAQRSREVLTVANYSTSIGPDQAPMSKVPEDRSRNRLQSSPRVPLPLPLRRHNASNSEGSFF